VELELFHADGRIDKKDGQQTYRHEEVVTFYKFANAPKKNPYRMQI